MKRRTNEPDLYEGCNDEMGVQSCYVYVQPIDSRRASHVNSLARSFKFEAWETEVPWEVESVQLESENWLDSVARCPRQNHRNILQVLIFSFRRRIANAFTLE